MRIAVAGPGGRLGRALVRLGCIPMPVDITKPVPLISCVEQVRPDVLINCAARTNVDSCETEGFQRVAWVNAEGVNLLRMCFRGILVQISTDYIFDGKKGPYLETDLPNPINVYGWSKLGGELAASSGEFIIIRTTVLYDNESGFIPWIVRRIKSGQVIRLSSTMSTTPTYIPDLARGILETIDKGHRGILNLAGSRVATRCEIGSWVAERMGGEIEADEYRGRANRPERAGLNTDLARKLGIYIGDPLDTLQEVIECLGGNGDKETG